MIHPGLGGYRYIYLSDNRKLQRDTFRFEQRIKWPAVLKSLTIKEIIPKESIEDVEGHPDLEPRDLQPILNRHRESLRYLAINEVSRAEPLDLSYFPSLESLCLFPRRWSNHDPEELYIGYLAAPKLRSLVLNFDSHHAVRYCIDDWGTYGSADYKSWEGWGWSEADWLEDVAVLARVKEAALGELHLIFGIASEYFWTLEWAKYARVRLEHYGVQLLID